MSWFYFIKLLYVGLLGGVLLSILGLMAICITNIITKPKHKLLKKSPIVGKLIAIEGCDGVGKNTQSQLLSDYISRQCGDCVLLSFPRYETIPGKRIAEYLRGEMDNLTLSDRIQLYADDRKDASEMIRFYLNSGINVVCDRYVLSNYAYMNQLAKDVSVDLGDVSSPNNVSEYLTKLEFETNQIPKVDLNIILILKQETADKLQLQKAERSYTKEAKDLHEKNTMLQNNVLGFYRDITDKSPHVRDWSKQNVLIYCDGENGTIRDKSSIHKEITSVINPLLEI
jgi:dTMP kinase